MPIASNHKPPLLLHREREYIAFANWWFRLDPSKHDMSGECHDAAWQGWLARSESGGPK